jgi:hypothetical protein
MTSPEMIEKRGEARECLLDRYFSVEFSPAGLETPFRSRIRDISGKGLCVQIPSDSRIIDYIKVGDILEMTYHPEKADMLPRKFKTEIRYIAPGGEGRSGCYFIGLRILEGDTHSMTLDK